MDRSSQLLLRNQEAFGGGEILLMNPPPDRLFQEFGAGRRPVRIWSQEFAHYRWFQNQGAKSGFGVFPDAAALPEQVVLFLPREKQRLDMLLHFLAASMPATGSLWLVGENQSGIRSAPKHLRKRFASTAKTDNARHCVLFRARHAIPCTPFSLEDYVQKWLLGAPGAELRMVSLPGAFAHGRLDPGTALLLATLSGLQGKDQPRGSVLDFACGIGIIGMSMLSRDPALDVTLLDNSALALESARQSLEANGMHAHLLPSDGLSEVNRRYDWIVSNPPFHRGVARDFDISRQFFARAGHVLSRQGTILLVCNRHLPYDMWLAEHFSLVETLAGNDSFKVLRASRPNV